MKNLKQDINSHKFSTDALLLAEFCNTHLPKKATHLAELGTGCGIISLEILEHNQHLQAIALDFNQDLLDTAKENAILYNLQHRIEFLLEDFNNFPNFSQSIKKYCNSIDLVVTNPPWLLENQGKLPHDSIKRQALFGNKDTYTLFFNSAKYLLKERGLLAFISIPSRMEDIFQSLKKCNFVLNKIQVVHKNSTSHGIFVLFLAEYKGKLAEQSLGNVEFLEGIFLE